MTGPITKIDAARRQLDCAINILNKEDLAAHTLAYAAYCLLRDLLGLEATLRNLANAVDLATIPNFLKHADRDPEAILPEHSPETAHLTISLAIRFWEVAGQEPTQVMQAFKQRPSSYKPGYRHSYALDYAKHGEITKPDDAVKVMVTLQSTQDAIKPTKPQS